MTLSFPLIIVHSFFDYDKLIFFKRAGYRKRYLPFLYFYANIFGGVVQLDRITDFGSVGWGFESSLPHKFRTHKELWVQFFTQRVLF